MKTNKLVLILIFLLSIHSFGQSQMEEKKEQIRTLKVGFITNELALTTDEATKFWPIYNAYDDKQFEIRHQKMKAFKQRMGADLDQMSEKDASSLLAQMENTEDELYQIRKKFVANLKGILPSVKIIKLKKAEDDFNRKLLQQYRNKGPRK
ncbi:sensor of ECF-type sigma factor [Flavobacterium franklandianum]|uniref:Sensor of ECF-type sigma factor n=1 Tax=Flavobacterium franklandianum TaxID=2594430 RepID=A0A553C6R7_9FLAO|nr:sensor of ECF-type sigma factor [Flavobacterium franklandianum]TRX16219.1 sensor of ECF-type sigma factor [Flavobacterium franklandianum]TRX29719.1 sensor of ECF-type sigma factor [Flavobacterium franklandianum]